MRIVFFDAIQEAHVTASLERAFIAAGHEVYATGRFGRGVDVADPQRVFRVAGPHLERIRAFRPDWILVFRPASAPPPVLAALRATGGQLATWLSDDPVLYGLSYRSAPEDYDLVLHCGDARVLAFYEEQVGRPTGVNLPFWTDHIAFPHVYGRRPAEATVMFLGNLAGPVRRRRYEQLAAMRHDVRVYGSVEEDPAGLSAGFLDTDAEVVAAGARARLALNIPQFFADHRGSPTWFDGLDALGRFELPSRVIQYAAMGLPIVSISPGAEPIASFPELPVCDSVADADDWIARALAEGTLDELSAGVSRRFDAHFSAAARVMAFEALAAGEEDWRRMDASERALWFTRFDATPTTGPVHGDAPTCGAVAASAALTATVCAAEPADRPVTTEPGTMHGVAVVHARQPSRFSGLDVTLRQLHADGAEPALWGPETVDEIADPATGAWSWLIDPRRAVPALRQAGADVLVLAEGVGVDVAAARALRQAGIATLLLLRDEPLTRAQAQAVDLVVCVGPGIVRRSGLLHSLGDAVHVPALVEREFLDLVRRTSPLSRPAVVGVAPTDDQAPDLRAWAPSPRVDGEGGAETEAPAERLDPATLREADLAQLCAALRRRRVLLEPVTIRGHRVHSALTGHALCAADRVLAPRWQDVDRPDVFAPRLLRAGTAAEAHARLDGDGQDADAGPGRARSDRDLFCSASDAGALLPAWFETARCRARARHDRAPLGQAPVRIAVVHGGRHPHADEDRAVVDALHALGHRVLEVNVARHDDVVHEVPGARGTALKVDLAPLERLVQRARPQVVLFAGRRLRPTPECARGLERDGVVRAALVRDPSAAVPNASLGVDAAVCLTDAAGPADLRDRLTAFLATALTTAAQPLPDVGVAEPAETRPGAPEQAGPGAQSPDADSPGRTVLISGYYGAGNIGDELLLRTLLERLERTREDVVPVVAAVDPAAVEREHGVQAFARADLREAEAWAARSSGVLLGPGGHWHDYSIARAGGLAGTFTGTRYSPAHLAQLPLMVRAHGGRVVVHGMGVGPLTDPAARAAVHLTGMQADLVSVRDDASRRLLEPMSQAWPATVTVAPDVVHALQLPDLHASGSHPGAPDGQDGAVPTGPDAPGWIAVNLRPWDAPSAGLDPRGPRACLGPVVDVARQCGLGLWFVAMQPTDEDEYEALVETAAGRVPVALLPADAPHGHLLHVLGGAAALVAMRLHASLLRHCLGGPAVGLSYDPKVSAHYAQLGRAEFCLPLDRAASDVGETLRAALRESPVHGGPGLPAPTRRAIEHARTGARAALDAALAVLCSGPAHVLDPSWRRR